MESSRNHVRCDECDQDVRADHLKRHKENNHSVVVCSSCNSECYGTASLRDHQKTCLGKRCNECDQIVRADHLKRHKENNHSVAVCSSCNSECYGTASLRNHQKTCLGKRVRCNECDHDVRAVNLKLHKANKHGVKICCSCNSECRGYASLREHKKKNAE